MRSESTLLTKALSGLVEMVAAFTVYNRLILGKILLAFLEVLLPLLPVLELHYRGELSAGISVLNRAAKSIETWKLSSQKILRLGRTIFSKVL